MKLNRRQLRKLILEYLPNIVPAETERQRADMEAYGQDFLGNRYMDAQQYYGDIAIPEELRQARYAVQSGNVDKMKAAHRSLTHLLRKMQNLGLDVGDLEYEKDKLSSAIHSAEQTTRGGMTDWMGRY